MAILNAVNYFENDSRLFNIGLIIVPTGGGKSGIISLLPYALGSHKVMVLSPSKVITNQLITTFGGTANEESFYRKREILSSNEIHNFVPSTYMIKTAKYDVPQMANSELIIVNAQKFSRTAKPEIILNGEHGHISANIFNDFDTIIVDEAHRYPAKTWKDIVEIFKDKKIIFLTATPNPDVKCDIIYEIKREELERRHIIRSIEFIPLDIDNMNNLNDIDFHRFAMKIKAALQEQDMDAGKVYHKAMILVKKNKHYTMEMAAKFNALNDLDLKATFCTSDPESEKNLTLFDKKNKDIRIMVICQKLTEGYDNSNVSVCVILRNIGSSILFSQFVGRCIRISHDRENCETADVKAKVYGPQDMWDKYDKNATEDPDDNMDE
uniref:Helicase ATP-binding domain-containing protein n=1 Tax=Panagrolaimus superbus TaxID=310955 RepID=A0A914YG57_9BILA